MNTIRFNVSGNAAGTYLADFLADSLDVSGRQAKRLLDARNVFVNRRRVWMARHRLRDGDVVEVTPLRAEAGSVPPPTLYEDEDYLVVAKPPGRNSNGPDSVESVLREQAGPDTLRAVHRLDRDTSGCLILAKTDAAFNAMVPLFRRREVSKRYRAVAAGKIDPPAQTVRDPIGGRPAITHLRALDTNRRASHVEVRTETGRTHQIRRHLASREHPLLGDRTYATRKAVRSKAVEVPRHMLHASSLEFRHPRTGRKVRVKAPLPRDFRACLKTFGLS